MDDVCHAALFEFLFKQVFCMDHRDVGRGIRFNYRDVDEVLDPCLFCFVQKVQVALIVDVVIADGRRAFCKAYRRYQNVSAVTGSLKGFRIGHVDLDELETGSDPDVPLHHVECGYFMTCRNQRPENVRSEIAVCTGQNYFHLPASGKLFHCYEFIIARSDAYLFGVFQGLCP